MHLYGRRLFKGTVGHQDTGVGDGGAVINGTGGVLEGRFRALRSHAPSRASPMRAAGASAQGERTRLIECECDDLPVPCALGPSKPERAQRAEQSRAELRS